MPGSEDEFKCCTRDFLFTCVNLSFLLDIGLDIWAAVSLYKQEAYVYFSLLLLFLLGSSMLVQVYSWLWYRYDDFKMKTKIEKKPSQCQLKLLHVFQLGIFFRYAGVMEKSVQSLYRKRADAESVAKFLRQDLRILRFIETFSESAPQLALMLTIILHKGWLDPVTDELKGATITEEQPEDEERSHSVPTRPLKATDNKRMRKLAENFFC